MVRRPIRGPGHAHRCQRRIDALLQRESRVVEETLDGIFGEECLQVGMWGDSRTFTRFTRTQRCAVIAETADGGPSAIGDFHRLPVESDSNPLRA